MLAAIALAVGLAACAEGNVGAGAGASARALADARDPDPQARFWSRLAARCGQAFSGGLATSDAADADLAGRPIIIHFASCASDRSRADEIHVAMHVGPRDGDAVNAATDGWDRSRTWVFTRRDKTITLSHDHRHRDGSRDAVTGYGGTTDQPGTPARQSFPVDEASRALFRRTGRDVSLTNVWTIEVAPPGQAGARLTYALTRPRPDSRDFRAVFDLDRPVAAPPPAWGHGPSAATGR